MAEPSPTQQELYDRLVMLLPNEPILVYGLDITDGIRFVTRNIHPSIDIIAMAKEFDNITYVDNGFAIWNNHLHTRTQIHKEMYIRYEQTKLQLNKEQSYLVSKLKEILGHTEGLGILPYYSKAIVLSTSGLGSDMDIITSIMLKKILATFVCYINKDGLVIIMERQI